MAGTGDPGAGGGQGGGVGTGEGPGTGPGGGEHGQGRPPQLRHQVFYLEKTPKELRGVPIRVTFSVDEAGRVARVVIEPPIQDRKFADGFRETMMQYRFRPAQGADGSPVAAEIELTFTY
jgi:TonB family protein